LAEGSADAVDRGDGDGYPTPGVVGRSASCPLPFVTTISNSEALGGIDEPKVAADGGGKVDIDEASGLAVPAPALTDLADITERGGGPSDPEVEAEREPGTIMSGFGERDLGYDGRDPAL